MEPSSRRFILERKVVNGGSFLYRVQVGPYETSVACWADHDVPLVRDILCLWAVHFYVEKEHRQDSYGSSYLWPDGDYVRELHLAHSGLLAVQSLFQERGYCFACSPSLRMFLKDMPLDLLSAVIQQDSNWVAIYSNYVAISYLEVSEERTWMLPGKTA